MWASIRVLVLMVVMAAFGGQQGIAVAASSSTTSSTSAYTEALSQLPTCAVRSFHDILGGGLRLAWTNIYGGNRNWNGHD